MITKASQEGLEKVAILNGWQNLGRNINRIYHSRPVQGVGRGILATAKGLGRGAVKTVDLGARGLEWLVDKTVESPYKVLPIVAATGLGTRAMYNKTIANTARIEDPDSGVTKISPFTGTVEFTDPRYKKYYQLTD